MEATAVGVGRMRWTAQERCTATGAWATKRPRSSVETTELAQNAIAPTEGFGRRRGTAAPRDSAAFADLTALSLPGVPERPASGCLGRAPVHRVAIRRHGFI